MPRTRILAFSDLAWGTRERGSPAGRKVDRDAFLRLVEETDPEIVVFAGDAAYDRCSRSGLDETDLFLGLLREIRAAGRHCVVVEWEDGLRQIELLAGKEVAATGCDPALLRDLTEGRGPIPYREEIEVLRRAKSETTSYGLDEVLRRLLAMGIRKTRIKRDLGSRRDRRKGRIPSPPPPGLYHCC